MSNEFCTICNSNCKSIHACKLFMLSPSLPTHPFYLTCLEFVGSHVFVWLLFYVGILVCLFVVVVFFSPPAFLFLRCNTTEVIKVSSRLGWLHPSGARSEWKWTIRRGSTQVWGCSGRFWQTFLLYMHVKYTSILNKYI